MRYFRGTKDDSHIREMTGVGDQEKETGKKTWRKTSNRRSDHTSYLYFVRQMPLLTMILLPQAPEHISCRRTASST